MFSAWRERARMRASAQTHIRFHPRPASDAVVRPEVSAQSSTKRSLGSRNEGGRAQARQGL